MCRLNRSVRRKRKVMLGDSEARDRTMWKDMYQLGNGEARSNKGLERQRLREGLSTDRKRLREGLSGLVTLPEDMAKESMWEHDVDPDVKEREKAVQGRLEKLMKNPQLRSKERVAKLRAELLEASRAAGRAGNHEMMLEFRELEEDLGRAETAKRAEEKARKEAEEAKAALKAEKEAARRPTAYNHGPAWRHGVVAVKMPRTVLKRAEVKIKQPTEDAEQLSRRKVCHMFDSIPQTVVLTTKALPGEQEPATPSEEPQTVWPYELQIVNLPSDGAASIGTAAYLLAAQQAEYYGVSEEAMIHGLELQVAIEDRTDTGFGLEWLAVDDMPLYEAPKVVASGLCAAWRFAAGLPSLQKLRASARTSPNASDTPLGVQTEQEQRVLEVRQRLRESEPEKDDLKKLEEEVERNAKTWGATSSVVAHATTR